VLYQPFQVDLVTDNSIEVFGGRKQLGVAHFAGHLHFPLEIQLEFFFKVPDFLIERVQEVLAPVFLRVLGLLFKIATAGLVSVYQVDSQTRGIDAENYLESSRIVLAESLKQVEFSHGVQRLEDVREFGGAVGRIEQTFNCSGAILEGVYVRSPGEVGSPFAVGLEASSARGLEPGLAAMEPEESPIKLRDARDEHLLEAVLGIECLTQGREKFREVGGVLAERLHVG
jgi:hypothetical protein